MTEIIAALLQWLVPAVVVFVIAALVVAISVWAVRRARRSPRARAAAEKLRAEAGAALVKLDDAVDELDVVMTVSGALHGSSAPTALRRARLSAQHTRAEGFADYESISEPTVHPVVIRRTSARIATRADDALVHIARARAEHDEWAKRHVSIDDQLVSARDRLEQLRASMGDPAALVRGLSTRFDEAEWQSASRAAHDALTAFTAAERHLDAAARRAADNPRDALAELAAAERSLRSAQADARTLEEAHRLVLQAAQALPDEFAAAHNALRLALVSREGLAEAEASRVGIEVAACEAELTAIERDAARRPTYSVERIALLRERLDLALGDARTAQQRLRGARTALPGTLAAARHAIAYAEAAVAHADAGADARARLITAQTELATARQVQDPVQALDAARRAMRHAGDAKGLADFSRLDR